MKKILLLFATMLTLTAKSQTSVYPPFPEGNAFWCVSAQWFDGTCDHTDNFSIYFGNDTLINGNIYHILRQAGLELSSLCGGVGYYYIPFKAAIRQDTLQHKVFMYDATTGGDAIFYDFNLQVGDTLNTSKVNWGIAADYMVSSIDSVMINGQYRKRYNTYNFMGGFSCNDSSIIEGIGSVSGLMSMPSSCFEYFSTLIGFEQNSIGLYPDTSSHCAVISGVENMLAANSIQVYPNPVIDKLNVTLNSHDDSEIILYDISSRKLLQEKFVNSVSLNMEKFAKGIYLYEVRNKKGVIKKGKVVKD